LDSEKQARYRAKLEVRWNERIRQLEEYKQRFGHCNVPLKWKENPALGAWLNKQREYYRCILRGTQGGSRGLSDARIAQLDAMGFCWNVEVTRDGTEAEVLAERSWNENLRKLEAYRAQHGDCCVSKSYNGPLANFVCARRAFKKQQEYNKAKVEAAAAEGTEESLSSKGMPHKHWLTPTRIWQLNELGFTWAIRDAPVDIWNDRYEKLREFKEKFGHCRVPIKYDKALSQWILSMRHYYKNTMDEKKAGEKAGEVIRG